MFLHLIESIWSLGGEAWFVLATQNSVWQRELDFRILQEKCFYVEVSDEQQKIVWNKWPSCIQ